MLRKFKLAFALLLLQTGISYAQSEIKVMAYNILNYSASPKDTTLRNPFYRTILRHVKPDIFVAEELNSSTAPKVLLKNVLNSVSSGYDAGTFIDGYDTDNGIFYKTSLFDFVSNNPIYTKLRDISEFTLVFKPTGDTIRIYAVHLQSSTGSGNETARGVEIDSLIKVTSKLPAGAKYMVVGDFNIYKSTEAAYQKLTDSTQKGTFRDPIQMTGTWAVAKYANFHTQSPRVRQFGGGAIGGMDDRFDMILFSPGMRSGSLSYVNNSTTAYGNDGKHFNDSINSRPNLAVGDTVADALHYASDHIPVLASFAYLPTAIKSNTPEYYNRISCQPNPATDKCVILYNISGQSEARITLSDFQGKVLDVITLNSATGEQKTEISTARLPAGIYLVQLETVFGKSQQKLLICR